MSHDEVYAGREEVLVCEGCCRNGSAIQRVGVLSALQLTPSPAACPHVE